jgi:hypothetical protein
MNGGDQVANGMGCLAAQLITLLKQDLRDRHVEMASYGKKLDEENGIERDNPHHDGMAGGYYIYPKGTTDVWEDFVYHLYFVKNPNTDEMKRVWDAFQEDPDNNPHPQDVIFEAGFVYLKLETNGGTVLYDGLFREFDPEANYNEHDEEDWPPPDHADGEDDDDEEN